MAESTASNIGKKRSPEAIRRRKEIVLDAAAGEFARKGYADADMDRIAEAARVGKGTIYRYYNSKEQLFEAVADDAINRLWKFVLSVIQMAQDEGPFEQLRAAGKAFLAFFDANQGLLEVFLRGGSRFRERMRMRYLQIYGENIHVIQNLVDRCIEDGIFREMDSHEFSDTVSDMFIGLVYMWGVRREKKPVADKWAFIEEIIFEGILSA